ncbi:uncharacterized protein F5147DRAFT_655374 [Suillus discolor]|uniref:Uncharacterized protein n=1 Tax=Suillus discolor TaxID=1912936 RepID=A0A9P7JR31_9AGAM|nr:uncharacterized protein F5147DRAFT_655374 [Suillus discolor]KAG2101028.1 hypothetical protein F5147DRAFT_655374 [Suillus discolor]
MEFWVVHFCSKICGRDNFSIERVIFFSWPAGACSDVLARLQAPGQPKPGQIEPGQAQAQFLLPSPSYCRVCQNDTSYFVLQLRELDGFLNKFQSFINGTVLTDGEDEPRVVRPICKIKPTAALLQHSEKVALPSQTKAINDFRAAEAAKSIYSEKIGSRVSKSLEKILNVVFMEVVGSSQSV